MLVIAPVIQQATIAFNFIKSYIENSPALEPSILDSRANEIELKNGVIIACRPCSYVTIRGVPIICAIFDEIAFWRHEETYANAEKEVLDAIRPSMATLHNTKLLKVSTAYRKEGILWRDFQERSELDHLVWQVSTEEMNPAAPKAFLDKERQRDPETFRREYLGEFTDHVSSFIIPELLDRCVMRGVREFPRVSNGAYVAAIDPAFRSSDFGFAVLHRSDDGSVTVAYVSRWSGSKTIPLDLESISAQINEILRRFGVNTLFGDQFCFPVLQQHFRKLGISYREFRFDSRTRASLYGNLMQLIAQQKITLVDDTELLRQLRSLEEHGQANGNVDVRPPRSQNDDMAIAVALAASELSKLPEPPPPILIARGGVDFSGDPGWWDQVCSSGVAGTCYKFPGCWDTKTCVCPPWSDS